MQPWNSDTFVQKVVPLQTNKTCSSDYIYESNEIRITRLTAESFLVVVGILFNIVICLVNLKHSRYNDAIRLYIRNMAFADVGVLVLGFPFAVAKEQEATGQWILGSIPCKYAYPITEVFYTVSTWSLVAIAIQRYRIVKPPKSWRRRRKPSRGARVIVVLWITAFVIISLPILLASHYGTVCGKMYCFIRWPTSSPSNTVPSKIHTFSLLFLLFIFPVGVVVWSYCKVSMVSRHGDYSKKGQPRHRRLQSDNSEHHSIHSEQEELRLQESHDVKRLLSPLVILYVITTIPSNILRIIFIFSGSTLTSLEQYLVLFNLSIMLVICNSVVRPFIYCLVSVDVRIGCKKFVNTLKQGFRRGWGEHHDEMMPLQEIRHSKTDYKETIL